MSLPADKFQRYRELARRVVSHQQTAQIARVMDRTPTTIRKWMRDPDFQKILKEMDEKVWAHVMEQLREAASESIFARAEQDMDDAYSVLHEIMDDKDTRRELRHKAALDILELGGARKRANEHQEKRPQLSTFHINILGETLRQVHGANDGETAVVPTADGESPKRHDA